MALLHYLNTKRKVNIAPVLMGHMLSVHGHPSQTLPHATFITYWLKTHWKVSPKDLLTQYLCYDNAALSRMFSYDDKTETWSIKQKPLVSSKNSASTSTDTNDNHSEPLATPSTPSILTPSDPSMDTPSDPSIASSNAQPSSSTIPVRPYTPTAPAYTPSAPGYSPFSPTPSPTDPLFNALITELIDKMDSLKIHSPSIELFNSVSQQMFNVLREHQNTTSLVLRRLEDKVDSFEDKMKGYGHYTHDCMLDILNAQMKMSEEQVDLKHSQIALLQLFRQIKPEDPELIAQWARSEQMKSSPAWARFNPDGRGKGKK